jgi:hypothetical protein
MPKRGETNILNLVLAEVWDHLNNDPRQASAKVNHFMHDEAQDSRSQDVILHPKIPSLQNSKYSLAIHHCDIRSPRERIAYRPEALGHVQLDIVLGHLVEDAEVVLGLVQGDRGFVPSGFTARQHQGSFDHRSLRLRDQHRATQIWRVATYRNSMATQQGLRLAAESNPKLL